MSRLIAGGRTSPYRALNGNPSLNSYAGAGNATASQPTTAAYSNLFRTPGSSQMGAQNNPTYNSGPPGYQGIAGTGGLYNQLQNASVTQGNAAAQSFFLPGDGSTPEDRFQTARQLMTDLNGKQRQGVIQPTDVQAWVPLLNKLKLKKLPDNPTAESAQRLNPILDQLDGLAQQGNIPSA